MSDRVDEDGRLVVRELSRSGLAPASFRIEGGECRPLTGPSGAGKSLLLRALADLDPNEGRVWLDRVERASMPAPAWRRKVAYLPAESGWWADRVGAHFTDAVRAGEDLAALGLDREALDWPVSRLSTGERQRAAFARLLAHDPPVLLLDEPTAALDDEATRRVETVLRAHLDRGAAIVMTTHDPDQAERMGSRRLRIADGRLEETDR